MPKKPRFVRADKRPRKTVSPSDLGVVDPDDEDDLEEVPASFVWSPSPGFPAYLRRIREAAELSIRKAAPALGVSYAWLARTETGGYAKPPSLKRLHAIAELYGVDPREVLHEAGVRVELPDDAGLGAALDARFRAVVLHPDLRPALLDPDALAYIPDRVKHQWLEFADKLAQHPDPAALLAQALADAETP